MSKTKLTPEETAELMEYMLNNFIEKTYHLGELDFVIRTLTVNQQMEAQRSVRGFEGSQLEWSQELRIRLLSHSIVSFGKKKFENAEQAYTFIKEGADLVINKLTDAQKRLQDHIKELLDRADDFTESPSS